MKWPWGNPVEDRSGMEKARRALAKARADEPRVANIVQAHREQQDRNHFGERFHQALKGIDSR